MTGTTTLALAAALYTSATELARYDAVLFDCVGTEVIKSSASRNRSSTTPPPAAASSPGTRATSGSSPPSEKSLEYTLLDLLNCK